LLAFLCSIAKDYEPGNNLYQFLLIGPRAYHILHPANVEALLSTNFRDYGFGARRSVFAPLLGSGGIFTQEGAAWRHSRELLRKQFFMRAQYQDLRYFHEHVGNLVACMPSDDGDVDVDLQPLFFNLTLDVATELLFGRSVYSLRAGVDQASENREFSESFNVAQEGLAKRFRIAPFHFLYSPPSFRRACRDVHRFVERYIRELGLMEKGRRVGDDAKKEGKGEPTSSWFIRQVAAESASVADLRDQLLNVLLAGRDTTACCLSWTL
jgi:cytochrome P450